MATQTRTQRQAAAKKAAATRKRNAARHSRGRNTTRRRAEAEITRIEALGRSAERALLIPIGAAAEARERLTKTARTATDRRRTRRARASAVWKAASSRWSTMYWATFFCDREKSSKRSRM